jgi:hypothetical protein
MAVMIHDVRRRQAFRRANNETGFVVPYRHDVHTNAKQPGLDTVLVETTQAELGIVESGLYKTGHRGRHAAWGIDTKDEISP